MKTACLYNFRDLDLNYRSKRLVFIFAEISLSEKEKEAAAKCRILDYAVWKFRIKLNPVVSLLSGMIIWALVVWCMIEPTKANKLFSASTSWITQTWTWLYIGTVLLPRACVITHVASNVFTVSVIPSVHRGWGVCVGRGAPGMSTFLAKYLPRHEHFLAQ